MFSLSSFSSPLFLALALYEVDVLEKSSIRSKDTGDVLIRTVEGPVTRYLPENARITGMVPILCFGHFYYSCS